MSINITCWDSAEYLKTEEDMQLYLEALNNEKRNHSIIY